MNYKKIIEKAFDEKEILKKKNNNEKLLKIINEILSFLNEGKLRICEKINQKWITHQWIKKTILLSLYFNENKIIENSKNPYFDKIPLKYSQYTYERFKKEKIRLAPTATVRFGACIQKNTILMPSFINIGAYIDKNTMIDTWSTIGSCAQIGKNVHISGGVGIGGVLEPIQDNPTIIEDNCFIGARSEIVEGVIVEEGSVVSMGVFIGKSTKIYNRETGEISYGKIPKKSVVVSGSLPSKDKTHNLYCAVIVKNVNDKTLSKVQINKLLRENEIKK
ncbi:2,3,4,5-tetrahydropyridine-2,6-dicarboxylate N-succinyltransferase [Buchnera aphidicola (Tetraneura ulmi)]